MRKDLRTSREVLEKGNKRGVLFEWPKDLSF